LQDESLYFNTLNIWPHYMIIHSSHACSCRKRQGCIYTVSQCTDQRGAEGGSDSKNPTRFKDTTTPQHYVCYNITTPLSDLEVFLIAQLYILCKPLIWPERYPSSPPHSNIDCTLFPPHQTPPMMQAMPDSRSQTFEEIYGPPENFLEIEVRLISRRLAT